MNFWLKHTDKDKFKLPVTPRSFDVSVDIFFLCVFCFCLLLLV